MIDRWRKRQSHREKEDADAENTNKYWESREKFRQEENEREQKNLGLTSKTTLRLLTLKTHSIIVRQCVRVALRL